MVAYDLKQQIVVVISPLPVHNRMLSQQLAVQDPEHSLSSANKNVQYPAHLESVNFSTLPNYTV
jgi:hypothetical protein